MEKKWFIATKLVSLFIILQQLAFLLIYMPEWGDNPYYASLKIGAWIFVLFYILFGIGIFMFRQLARKTFVIFQVFIIVGKILSSFINFYIISFGKGLPPPSPLEQIKIFWIGLSYPFNFSLPHSIPLSFILNLLYIYFFTRPKVKEQFKKE